MSEAVIIFVNKETVSDDAYKVSGRYVNSGEPVRQGDLIGSIETSKADIDIEAPSAGFVHHKINVGDLVKVGSVFAIITQSKDFPEGIFKQSEIAVKAEPSAQASMGNEIRISKSARELIARNNIDISVFKGKTMISAQDVEAYLASSGGKQTAVLSIEPREDSILIVGGGGHAKVCIDMIRQMGNYSIIGVTDTHHPIGSEVMGVKVLGTNADFQQLYDKGIRNAVIGVGTLADPKVRYNLYLQLKRIGFRFPNLIHPRAIIEPSAVLGEGNQVMAGAYISSDVRVGDNCIINSSCTLSHECVIGNNVHITPGATLAGTVHVGDNSVIGMNASVLLKVKIGRNVMVNNGVNIFKDIPDNTIVRS